MNRMEEVLAVKRLGEQIGYGNMMSIASGLWAIMLEDEYGIDSGSFVPELIWNLNETAREVAEINLTVRKRMLRQQLAGLEVKSDERNEDPERRIPTC